VTDWKYCIPHAWEHPRQIWEDVYLLPDDPAYAGPGLHLTMDGLENVLCSLPDAERQAAEADALAQLGDAEFRIDGGDMLSRQEDFSREEPLSWVRVWLAHHGFSVERLREAPEAEFAERVERAGVVDRLKAMYSTGTS
jgi:hypothetical protein